jgi:hypothetical protein
MASDDHPGLWSGALVGGRASVGSVRRRKVRRMWLPPGSVITPGVTRRDGAEVHGFYLGRWRNGSKRPVLKHGPRSLTSMRVFGCEARPRNESECRREPLEGAPPTGPGVYRRI